MKPADADRDRPLTEGARDRVQDRLTQLRVKRGRVA